MTATTLWNRYGSPTRVDAAAEAGHEQPDERGGDRAERERERPDPPRVDQRVLGAARVGAGRKQPPPAVVRWRKTVGAMATTAQITTSGGTSTPNVFVRRRRERISHSGALPRDSPPGLRLDETDRDRAHGQRHDQRLDVERWQIWPASAPRSAAADDARSGARRANDSPTSSLSWVTTSALATMKPGDREVEAAHQDEQRLPHRRKAGERRKHEDELDAAPGREAERRRAVREDRDQGDDLQDRERACRRRARRQGRARVGRVSAARRRRRAHTATFARAARPPSTTATSSITPYMTCSQLGLTLRVISRLPSR